MVHLEQSWFTEIMDDFWKGVDQIIDKAVEEIKSRSFSILSFPFFPISENELPFPSAISHCRAREVASQLEEKMISHGYQLKKSEEKQTTSESLTDIWAISAFVDIYEYKHLYESECWIWFSVQIKVIHRIDDNITTVSVSVLKNDSYIEIGSCSYDYYKNLRSPAPKKQDQYTKGVKSQIQEPKKISARKVFLTMWFMWFFSS